MELDKQGGDASKATASLKQLTNKMAECKRLIKEFERSAKADGSLEASVISSRKREYVNELNKFVGLKKNAQTTIAAKQELLEGEKESGADMSKGKGGGSSSQADPGKGVELQMMETGDLVQHGREVMKETDQSIERSKAVVQETIQIGQTTAEALKGQTKQMEKIVDDLDEIHFSMKKTAKIIKDITRGMATDKCILLLLLIVVLGVIAVIAVKAAGLDKDDEVISIPGASNSGSTANEQTPASPARRLLYFLYN